MSFRKNGYFITPIPEMAHNHGISDQLTPSFKMISFMDGHIVQWDETIGLFPKLSGEVHVVREAERLAHGPRAVGSPPAIINTNLIKNEPRERKVRPRYGQKELLTN